MAEDLTQAFYTDRRNRGMTDAMIVNELEASGWSMADAKVAVDKARLAYVPLSTPGFSKIGDAIEYDVPAEYHKQSRKKFILGLIFAVPILILEVFTEDPIAGFSFSSFFFAIIILLIFSIFGWFSFKRRAPQRIRFDAEGYTIMQPKGKLHRWASYKSYSFGMPEGKQTWFKRFAQPSPLQPDSPVIVLQPKASVWARSSDQATVQLPYPPQEQKALEELLKHVFPIASVIKPTKLGWRHNPYVIVGIAFGLPLMAVFVYIIWYLFQ